MMELYIERKIKINDWLIKARWLYGLGVFGIGILSKTISATNVNFPFRLMIELLVFFYSINIVFLLFFRSVQTSKSPASLNVLSILQIIFELFILTVIMHYAGGITSISPVFYFMPIVASSFLFGTLGSLATAAGSAVAINILVILEYYNYIPHISRYSVQTIDFSDLSISLTKTISISIFYIIVGIYTGYGAKMLFDREKVIEEKTDQLKIKTSLLVGREKKLSETNNRLEEEEKKIGSIISNFTDPVIFIDSVGKISLFNPVAKEVLGFDETTVGQKVSSIDNFSLNNFHDFIKSEYKVKKIINQEVRGGGEAEEMTLLYNEQERTYKIMTASVCDSGGTCYGFIKVFYDLTQEKRIDQMKSDFISIAAHQLRTPLSGIKWAIKMILDGDTGQINEEQKDLLQKGYESNERIIGLVNDMLNVSRIEAEKIDYKFEMCDFMTPLNKVVSELKDQIEKKKIKLVVNVPKILPLVYCDKEKIILAIQGLIENSVKYTPDYGRIEVSLSVLKKFLKVSIRDNGMGIPKSDQDKLFTKFFRAQNAKRMQTDGSGLGLFIVKNIVTKHGGEIELKSKEGAGTEFTFTIPLKEKNI